MPDNHRDGEYGFGTSKTQHFIQHMRDHSPEKDPNSWRDNQEKFLEQALLACTDELSCPVCKENWTLLIKKAADDNRVLQGKKPIYPDYEKVSLALCKHSCDNPKIKELKEDIFEMR